MEVFDTSPIQIADVLWQYVLSYLIKKLQFLIFPGQKSDEFDQKRIEYLKMSNQVKNFLKGEMRKKASEHIWLPFFQFSTDFNETLSKCFFFPGRLNEMFKSELTLLFFHSFQGGTKGKKLKNQKKQKKCSQMC